jgi:hypothetical protein
MDEIPLAGGNMTAGVVRVGDTVRRPTSPQSQTVHRLLVHARDRGVEWLPRVHGVDDQGREILDFIEGEVLHGNPEWMWEPAVLHDVVRALRQFHDATADFPRSAGDVWFWPGKEPAEVICHVDFAPYNHVFRGERFAGAIDFDLCYPAPRLWDLAWTVYRYGPLTPPRDAQVPDGEGADRSPFDVATMQERAQRALDDYGPYAGADGGTARVRTVAELLGWVVPRLEAIADWGAQQDSPEHQGWARMYRAHARWIEQGGLGEVESVEVRDVP